LVLIEYGCPISPETFISLSQYLLETKKIEIRHLEYLSRVEDMLIKILLLLVQSKSMDLLPAKEKSTLFEWVALFRQHVLESPQWSSYGHRSSVPSSPKPLHHSSSNNHSASRIFDTILSAIDSKRDLREFFKTIDNLTERIESACMDTSGVNEQSREADLESIALNLFKHWQRSREQKKPTKSPSFWGFMNE
jgi:hypothetical protein